MEISVPYIKSLGKKDNQSEKNLSYLLDLFTNNYPIDIKREIVSSIGRHSNNDRIFNFINNEAFNNHPMDVIYQMYRTCLYKHNDERFITLGNKIKSTYNNEVINKMYDYYHYKQSKHIRTKNIINNPLLIIGDSSKTLSQIPDNSIQLTFTSPPYYNAREYSDYHSYKDYLIKMKEVFTACHRVTEEGRFLIINISPIITKRAGREFESIRYPIPYDYHHILEEIGFYFVDEIVWIKPEPSVPNRIGGYLQTRKPLSYKPNCITESIMVYRKQCNYLLDKNINDYSTYNKFNNETIDTSNCWYIAPKSDKNHPAVFPEELCRRILKYYSFEGDTVLDPFAGSGTVGKVARKMNRIPIMCEMNNQYANNIINNNQDYYTVINNR